MIHKDLINDAVFIIPADGTESQGYDTGGGQQPGMIFMPDAWDSASIAFYVSWDGLNYKQGIAYDAGVYTPMVLDVTESGHYEIPAHWLYAARYIKLASSVAQSAERRLVLAMRPV